MFPDIQWKDMPVFQIRLPGENLAGVGLSPEEYLFDRFRIGPEEKELFTEEAALCLAKLHPIMVWSSNNYCVSGLRTLFIISSIIPATTISVGVLSSSLTDNDAQRLILIDAWLTNLAFSSKSPQASLYEAKKRTPKRLLQEFSPALDIKVADFARVLGVSSPTLYGLRRQEKKAKMR